METIVLTVHVIACILLIVLVLLQSGKEGMGVIFGGGSSSLFGGSGAGGLLVKITTFLVAIFLTTSLTYNYLTKTPKSSSVMTGVETEESAPAPDADAPADTGAEDGAGDTELPSTDGN